MLWKLKYRISEMMVIISGKNFMLLFWMMLVIWVDIIGGLANWICFFIWCCFKIWWMFWYIFCMLEELFLGIFNFIWIEVVLSFLDIYSFDNSGLESIVVLMVIVFFLVLGSWVIIEDIFNMLFLFCMFFIFSRLCMCLIGCRWIVRFLR